MNDEHFASRLKKTLEKHSGYNVMVIGYSLGAGICQLVVMDMLAGEHKVHTTFVDPWSKGIFSRIRIFTQILEDETE